MKDNKTLDNLIASEKAKLKKLEEKYSEIAGKIKASKSAIQNYEMMKNSQQFNAISNALDSKGISIEDVLSAITAGDLLSLQEKIANSVSIEEKSLESE